MRYLPTSKLTPGMALGQDIYDGAGRLLLAKHLLLSEEYISNLEFLGFPGIYRDPAGFKSAGEESGTESSA